MNPKPKFAIDDVVQVVGFPSRKVILNRAVIIGREYTRNSRNYDTGVQRNNPCWGYELQPQTPGDERYTVESNLRLIPDASSREIIEMICDQVPGVEV